MSSISKSIESESKLVVIRGYGKGKWGVPANGCRNFGDDENILKLDTAGIRYSVNIPEPPNCILEKGELYMM